MDAAKMMTLQRQMKENQHDLGDFLNDLDSWTSDIKKKDETLKKQKTGEVEKLPPVRNSLEKKKKKKVKKLKGDKEACITASQPKKIKGYDYRSWDKFDVDKACEEVEEKNSSSESEYETDEEWEIERKKQQASVYKDQGNQHFKEGKYDKAIECYTMGIDCDSENSVLPANRAMALLKQEKYGAAELDCTQALHLDANYIKAYQRRGTARAALAKYEDARSDFLAVLEREPNNKLAKTELDKVQRLMNPPNVKSENLQTDEIGLVKAVYKPLSQRSKKPLRHIEIEEIGIEKTIIRPPEQSDMKRRIEAEEKNKFEEHFMKTNNHLSDIDDATSNNLRNKITEITNRVTELSLREDENGMERKATDSSQDIDAEIKHKTNDIKSPESSSNEHSPRLPSVPTTSFQFQTDFKSLKTNPDKCYQYIKALPPKELPKLLGTSLEADLLNCILGTLQKYYILRGENVYPVLVGLSKVKRFDMTVMFMSKTEKAVVQDLMDHVRSSESAPADEIIKLEKKYGL